MTLADVNMAEVVFHKQKKARNVCMYIIIWLQRKYVYKGRTVVGNVVVTELLNFLTSVASRNPKIDGFSLKKDFQKRLNSQFYLLS